MKEEQEYTTPFAFFTDPVEFVWNFISEELDEKIDYEDLVLFFDCETAFMKQSKLVIEGVVMTGDESEDKLIYYLQRNLSDKLILTINEVKELLWLEKEYYLGVEELNREDEN